MHLLYNCGQKGFCSTTISSIDANCNCYRVCNNWVCSVRCTMLLLSCYKHDASFASDLAQDASRIMLKC